MIQPPMQNEIGSSSSNGSADIDERLLARRSTVLVSTLRSTCQGNNEHGRDTATNVVIAVRYDIPGIR